MEFLLHKPPHKTSGTRSCLPDVPLPVAIGLRPIPLAGACPARLVPTVCEIFTISTESPGIGQFVL